MTTLSRAILKAPIPSRSEGNAAYIQLNSQTSEFCKIITNKYCTLVRNFWMKVFKQHKNGHERIQTEQKH